MILRPKPLATLRLPSPAQLRLRSRWLRTAVSYAKSFEDAAFAAAAAMLVLERHDSRTARELGPWLADAVLADRLGWAHAVPLLGIHPVVGDGRSPHAERQIGARGPATYLCDGVRPPRRPPAGRCPKTACERGGCRRRNAACRRFSGRFTERAGHERSRPAPPVRLSSRP
ncbi:MAG: DUF1403 family protein [Mesorhizobium sp.]|nr:MAG: DUF1403 family protein [Mesorhizobium sp.]